MAALLLIAVADTRLAQEAPAKQPPDATKPQVALPDADKIVLLIRTALLTLNDSVQTGNFTVMRDKAAPSFQAANTAAQLGMIFQSLSRQGIDLAAVSIIAPQLTETPTIDENQRLRLKGFFPGTPVRIDFSLLFEAVAGHWRLFGISVNPAATGASAGPPIEPLKQGAPAKPPGWTAETNKK